MDDRTDDTESAVQARVMTTVFQSLQNRGLTPGFVVQSIAGHDSGRIYLVLRLDGRFAWLADGVVRTVARPKRKRVRHVRQLGRIDAWDHLDTLLAITDPGQQNAVLRRLLETYISQHILKEER